VSLAFLSCSGAAAARSPLLDAALRHGARTEARDGWEVVASFGDPAAEAAACSANVGFADFSHLAKLELNYGGGRTFSPGEAQRLEAGWRCPVRPTLDLVIAEPTWAGAARESLETEGSVCDLTSSLAAISIAGPRARETIARFCAIDTRAASLPLAGFRPGSVARTPGYLLRDGEERFLMLFGAAFAEYVWEVVADAAGRLGGRPVGADSLPASTAEAARA
jgi:glycine cleavage system aminomethyltransferase T